MRLTISIEFDIVFVELDGVECLTEVKRIVTTEHCSLSLLHCFRYCKTGYSNGTADCWKQKDRQKVYISARVAVIFNFLNVDDYDDDGSKRQNLYLNIKQ